VSWVTLRIFGGRWADYKALGHISIYVALIQISVVLADKLDTTVLGFMMPDKMRTEAALTCTVWSAKRS